MHGDLITGAGLLAVVATVVIAVVIQEVCFCYTFQVFPSEKSHYQTLKKITFCALRTLEKPHV